MSPINPNFKPGVGHLVTDRFDFQSHIDGTDFRQAAGTVDLSPSVTIAAGTYTDVQTAIEALAGNIIVPAVPDATTASKGIIQLGGDLFGINTTALNPRVSGLQGTPIANLNLGALDVGKVLTWGGSSWSATLVPGSIAIAGDLAGVGSTLSVPKVGGLQGRTISANAPTTGQALVWNGSTWLPTGIPSSPTGTGFATVTSGTFDTAASSTIRYTGPGGKFQTDVNIQYNNSGIFGDLAWAPISTNKTLTLPNATDTLVGKATTDTLTNKTITAANNTINDTSIDTGDLFKSNGTKFVRFPKGSALQVLRTNSSGTDLEWATAASGSSSAGVANSVQTSDGSGGFQTPGNIFAGSGFISVGTTTASTGYLRMSYNVSLNAIINTKNNTSVDSAVISQADQDLYFGNIAPVSTAMSSTIRGLNVTVDPVQQFRISTFDGGAGNYAFIVDDSGQSTKINVPHGTGNYAAIETRLSLGNTGPRMLFFGGVTGVATGASSFIEIANSPLLPTGTPVGGGYLFVSSGALKYTGSSGTVTTVAPADPHCKRCGRDFMHEWENPDYGKLSTCMPCLLDSLEAIGIDVNAFSDRNLS